MGERGGGGVGGRLKNPPLQPLNLPPFCLLPPPAPQDGTDQLRTDLLQLVGEIKESDGHADGLQQHGENQDEPAGLARAGTAGCHHGGRWRTKGGLARVRERTGDGRRCPCVEGEACWPRIRVVKVEPRRDFAFQSPLAPPPFPCSL